MARAFVYSQLMAKLFGVSLTHGHSLCLFPAHCKLFVYSQLMALLFVYLYLTATLFVYF